MRVMDDPELKQQAADAATYLCQVIEQMDLETGREYVNWLVRSADCMRTAPGFSPMNLVRYQLGDVIYVDFGFNVGSELRGPHWAVVIERNSRANPCVIVVPFGSRKPSPDGSPRPRRSGEVFLGDIGLGGSTVAKVDQIRVISKQRIIRPRHRSQQAHALCACQLRLLDEALRHLLAGSRQM